MHCIAAADCPDSECGPNTFVLAEACCFSQVAQLQSAMAAMGSPVTTAQPATAASPTNQSSSASPSTAVTAASTSQAPAGSAALAPLQRGASGVKQQQPGGVNQAGDVTRDEQDR